MIWYYVQKIMHTLDLVNEPYLWFWITGKSHKLHTYSYSVHVSLTFSKSIDDMALSNAFVTPSICFAIWKK